VGQLRKLNSQTQSPAKIESQRWFQATRMREMIGKSGRSNPDFDEIDVFV
jgi:hypothetical protein